MARKSIPGSTSVTFNLPQSLVRAIETRAADTGDNLDHIVQDAIARALNVPLHTLFQVSTSTALVQGVYQGCVTVETVRQHGDFGLGTFDSLDGEGLMLDGKVFHAVGDGSVSEAPDSASAPFWVSARFAADRTSNLNQVTGWDDLCRQIDALRNSPNLFAAVRIDGLFDTIHYRVACKAAPGTDLVTATSHQAEFTRRETRGTLLGFWSPAYARTFNIPGYHLHFLSDDRRSGGHVLAVAGRDLKLQVMDANQLVMALPETSEFLRADLTADPSAALSKAEGAGAKS